MALCDPPALLVQEGYFQPQLARMLGVTVKTAWFMSHRVREAMAPVPPTSLPWAAKALWLRPMRRRLAPSRKTRPRARAKNLKFMSLVERDGRTRSRK